MAARDHNKALDELRARQVNYLRVAWWVRHDGFGCELRALSRDNVRATIAHIRALDALRSLAPCFSCIDATPTQCRVYAGVPFCRRHYERHPEPGQPPWHKLPLYKREVPA